MDEVLHANIFFLIASVATVIFCIFLCFILYHVLKITRSVRAIVERIEESGEMIAKDVAHVRHLVASGTIWSGVVQFFMSIAGGRSRSRRRTRADDKN